MYRRISVQYFVVDAFTDRVFSGNPAGVCLPDKQLDEITMQHIAAENNLSETAFVVKEGNEYGLRWFTPKDEIDLCGHATLATAYIISRFVDIGKERMAFHTMSGLLEVVRKGDLFEMDFPARIPEKALFTEEMAGATGIRQGEAYLSRDLVIAVETEEEVQNVSPDFPKLTALADGLGVIITAPGREVDFVSRFFAPKLGINEDPVTGSAHCSLIPFWSERLHKTSLVAKQLSARGGMLWCEMAGERVKISGKASLYLTGEIHI